eukprot:gene6012-12123_t
MTPLESSSELTPVEATQQEPDTFVEAENKILDEAVCLDQKPKPWARLVSMCASIPHKDLLPSPSASDRNKNDFNVYQLGRSTRCHFTFENKLISNKHCKIFCRNKYDCIVNSDYDVFIEDHSANGTYIITYDNITRLQKGVRRLLHNGDQISLINPLSTNTNANPIDTATKSNEIQSCSFIIQILLNFSFNLKPAFPIPNQISKKNHNIYKSNTLVNLLNKDRSVRDYYNFERKIGDGASGQVYYCRNKDNGNEYAIKIIDTRPSKLQHEETLTSRVHASQMFSQDLLREAEIVRSLKHTNIIQLEDIFSEGYRLFLAASVIYQILTAIAYIHEKNIAHRDLKPENILLMSRSSDVDIKITDFGLAKHLDEGGFRGLKTYCGTPQYLSPEVLKRHKRHNNSDPQTLRSLYSLEADMWSIGIITIVLLSGSLPWSEDEQLRDEQIQGASYSLSGSVWSHVSSAAKDFISHLVVIEVEKRYTAKQALQHAWFSHLQLAIEASTSNDTTTSTSLSSLGKDDNVFINNAVEDDFELEVEVRSPMKMAISSMEITSSMIEIDEDIPNRLADIHIRSEKSNNCCDVGVEVEVEFDDMGMKQDLFFEKSSCKHVDMNIDITTSNTTNNNNRNNGENTIHQPEHTSSPKGRSSSLSGSSLMLLSPSASPMFNFNDPTSTYLLETFDSPDDDDNDTNNVIDVDDDDASASGGSSSMRKRPRKGEILPGRNIGKTIMTPTTTSTNNGNNGDIRQQHQSHQHYQSQSVISTFFPVKGGKSSKSKQDKNNDNNNGKVSGRSGSRSQSRSQHRSSTIAIAKAKAIPSNITNTVNMNCIDVHNLYNSTNGGCGSTRMRTSDIKDKLNKNTSDKIATKAKEVQEDNINTTTCHISNTTTSNPN